MMNINCIICSDLFGPSSEIYSTTCGHIFHYVCLIQWIERSRTCPQCRSKSTEKTIHRVYFNFSNTEGIVDDVGTLQSKIDTLKFQMTLREKDIKIYSDKYKSHKNQNVLLREEIKGLENKAKVAESAMHALKDQVKYFKEKSRDNDKLCTELIRVKEKLRDMENVALVSSGTREQVNDMLKHNRDPESLTLFVTTLKKELIDADKKRREINYSLKQTQNEVINYRRELSELTKHNTSLQHEIEAHKLCESERRHLKRKVIELEARMTETKNAPSTPDTSLRRIITESPAPVTKRFSIADFTLDKFKSPSLPEKVRSIIDTDSPYLPLKSSSVGIPSLANTRYISGSSSNNKTSIFKQPPPKLENTRVLKPEYSYDGLGGHSKEEKFPSPRKSSGLKRVKSSTSVTSTKFRKLAPNKKLNDFFSSQESDT